MMRKPIWSGICAAVLFTATAAMHAQQPSQQPTPASPPSAAQQPATQPPTPSPSSAATQAGANKITVTGCLQAAPEGPTGTSGTAGAAASAEKFVLTNASSGAPSAAGANAAASVRSYRLVGNEQALAQATGKKIEVTGTVDSQASAPRGSSSAASDPSAIANAPRLIVESGKIIAPTCTD